MDTMHEEFDSKDAMRIRDIIKKASTGNSFDVNKSRALAQQMANSITGSAKAQRRGEAAEDENFHDLAAIFFDRAHQIENKMESTSLNERSPDMQPGDRARAAKAADPSCTICHGEGVIDYDLGGGDYEEGLCDCISNHDNIFDPRQAGDDDGVEYGDPREASWDRYEATTWVTHGPVNFALQEDTLNGYVCFYKGKRIEVQASTSYGAQQKAAEQLKVPEKQRYQISVTLAEKDGKPVTHIATEETKPKAQPKRCDLCGSTKNVTMAGDTPICKECDVDEAVTVKGFGEFMTEDHKCTQCGKTVSGAFGKGIVCDECGKTPIKEDDASTRITKRALIREPGAPIGQSAPMFLMCGCGNKVYVPLMFSDQQTVACYDCGQKYNRKGYLVEATGAQNRAAHRGAPRCELCACRATGEKFGFKVCDWHKTHGEGDAPCPICAKSNPSMRQEDVKQPDNAPIEYPKGMFKKKALNIKEDWTEDTVTCKKCGATINALEVFPGGICLQCHAAKVDKLPPEKPDFAGTINKKAFKEAYTISTVAGKMLISESRESFFDGYVTCALWSSTDNSTEQGGEPLDSNYDSGDIAPETLKDMRADCDAFEQANADDLAQAGDDGQNGHDFWLTRNGHGAGFWDRGYGDVGERLSKAAKVYGSYDLYVGDDGKVYGS